MEKLPFIKKVENAKPGIVQLICHEKQLNPYLDKLVHHVVAVRDPCENIDDYEYIKQLMATYTGVTIVVPHFLQKDHAFSYPVLKPVEGIRTGQRLNGILKDIMLLCGKRDNKLISIDVVPNDYEYDMETIHIALNPILQLTSFISSHMAYLCGDDSIVIRDKELPADDMDTALNKIKEMCRNKEITVVTAKEIKHPKTIIVGDETSGLTAHRQSSLHPDMYSVEVLARPDTELFISSQRLTEPEKGDVSISVAKVREIEDSGILFNINHELGTVSTVLPNGEDMVISKTGPYESKRGIMLLCQTPSDKPILTAENYTKWYDLFVLFPDGSVKGLNDLGIDLFEVEGMVCGCPHRDDNFHPEIWRRLCKEQDWYICEMAMEVAAGRWAVEYHEQFDEAQYFTD